ncbi:MAG: hypothetical protein DSY59_02520, partial [Persephonella sp.]
MKTDNPGSTANDKFLIPITNTNGAGYNVDCNNDGTDEATGITDTVYPNGYTCDYTPLGGAGTYT